MPLGTENVFSARFSEFMHTLHGKYLNYPANGFECTGG